MKWDRRWKRLNGRLRLGLTLCTTTVEMRRSVTGVEEGRLDARGWTPSTAAVDMDRPRRADARLLLAEFSQGDAGGGERRRRPEPRRQRSAIEAEEHHRNWAGGVDASSDTAAKGHGGGHVAAKLTGRWSFSTWTGRGISGGVNESLRKIIIWDPFNGGCGAI
jgi:hypothetical protein